MLWFMRELVGDRITGWFTGQKETQTCPIAVLAMGHIHLYNCGKQDQRSGAAGGIAQTADDNGVDYIGFAWVGRSQTSR